MAAETTQSVNPVDVYAGQYESGEKAFSHGTDGAVTTPFLEEVHAHLDERWGDEPFSGADLGAGLGDHTVALAERHGSAHMFAVESCDIAAGGIKRLAEERLADRTDSLTVVQGSFFDFLGEQGDESLQLIYMNSILHFLSDEERAEVLTQAHRVLSEDGLFAVSFKRTGDSLEADGEDLGETELGHVVRAASGLTRVFMDPDTGAAAFTDRLDDAGLELVEEPTLWKVEGYDGDDREARFIGFVAANAA